MGFSATWLSLREAADHAARDQALLKAAADAAMAKEPAVVVDLGGGTGSTRRAFGDLLTDAHWRVVDADPTLLELAEGERHLCDLNDIEMLPLVDATLVTASALFDLVSEDWVQRLLQSLAAQRTPIYAALNYDGEMSWEPSVEADKAIRAAFNTHQRTDKGFGKALGPNAVAFAKIVLEAENYSVFVAKSDWVLGPENTELQSELLSGIAQAAEEIGVRNSSSWLAQRTKVIADSVCRIGHLDMLAVPSELINQ